MMEYQEKRKPAGSRRAAMWGVAVAAMVAGLGLWWWAATRPPLAADSVRAADDHGAGPEAGAGRTDGDMDRVDAGEAPRLWLEVGDRLTYAVSQSHAVNLTFMTEFSFAAPPSPGQPAPPPPPAEMVPKTMETKQSMQGQLKIEVLAELAPSADRPDAPSGWLVECALSGMTMDMSLEGVDIPQDEDMRRQMQLAKDKLTGEAMRSTVQAEVRVSGEIGKIVAATDSPEVRNQWRGILTRWQVVLPDSADVQDWELQQQDDTGIYVARYEWRSADYPRKLLKRKLRYTKLMLNTPSGPAMQPDHAVEGETHVVLEAYPVSIGGWETKKISSKGKGAFSVKGDSRFSLELVSAENDPSLAARGAELLSRFLQQTNVMAWAGESGPSGGQELPRTPEDVEQLLDLLRTSIRFYGGDSPQALNIAALLIKALQAGGPELVEVIMNALSEDYSDVGYAMVLTGVLGAAGTEACQAGLLEIIGTDDWPSEIKEMSYTSLAQVTEPIPGMEAVLIGQHEHGPEAYRDTALLLLAHAGHHLDGMDDQRRAAVVEYIQGQLAGVDANHFGRDLSLALVVLGNLGPADVPELVLRAAHSQDPWVRAEALGSLSRVHTEEAYALVFQGMLDEDETVRLSAVRALGDQNPSGGLDALRALLEDEPSDNVRNLAVATLVNSYWGDDEAVAALLREIAQNDPSAEVRATAVEMIENVGTRPWGTAE